MRRVSLSDANYINLKFWVLHNLDPEGSRTHHPAGSDGEQLRKIVGYLIHKNLQESISSTGGKNIVLKIERRIVKRKRDT
ncbi:hypothetical protein PGT21_005490 [Puccinia graminis f. sp. tritici]|uniref:Uncharacterized protein n=1 Tax=Puccinia graminis f. sp. tritici TaxID=56615 RepID=A0A5B0MCX5_PUCGR|nr:hypothetical protein PGT21_005490 [Puccinia graminis f. sp. tritici]